MVINYSKNAPLSEALQKTFDGQHPCQLCKVVAAGKKSERNQEFQKKVAKLDLLCAAALLSVPSPCSFPVPTTEIHFSPLRAEPPPGPPPRRA